MKYIKKRITDYDPDYPEQTEEDLKAKVLISVMNHMSILDGHMTFTRRITASLAKYFAKSAPFYGSIISNTQGIYVKRKNIVQKAKILK
jgi:hypothetical protein